MTAYLPTTPAAGAAPLLLMLAEAVLLFPLLLARKRTGRVLVWAAWLALLAAFTAAVLGTAGQPAGFRMVAFIAVVFVGMKLVVLASVRAAGGTLPAGWRLPAFAFLWPGMNPAPFAKPVATGQARHNARHGHAAKTYALRGLAFLAGGVVLFLAARAAYGGPGVAGTPWAVPPLVATMLAFSAVVHFGLFGLVAAAWRAAGVPVGELFRAPWRARGLDEFWGRRWNLAYVEMIALAVYRPALRRFGAGPATGLAFLFSGLLHEVAISFPVGTGYGLPTLYFLLQALALRLERHPATRRLLRADAARRAWCFAWILLPAPVLFFPAFVRGIIAPLLAG